MSAALGMARLVPAKVCSGKAAGLGWAQLTWPWSRGDPARAAANTQSDPTHTAGRGAADRGGCASRVERLG